MPTLSMDDMLLKKVKGQKIDSPTSEEYKKEAEKNSKELERKLCEYTKAYMEAANYYVK